MGQGILTEKSCNMGVPRLLGGVGPPGGARALSGLTVKPESVRQPGGGVYLTIIQQPCVHPLEFTGEPELFRRVPGRRVAREGTVHTVTCETEACSLIFQVFLILAPSGLPMVELLLLFHSRLYGSIEP